MLIQALKDIDNAKKDLATQLDLVDFAVFKLFATHDSIRHIIENNKRLAELTNPINLPFSAPEIFLYNKIKELDPNDFPEAKTPEKILLDIFNNISIQIEEVEEKIKAYTIKQKIIINLYLLGYKTLKTLLNYRDLKPYVYSFYFGNSKEIDYEAFTKTNKYSYFLKVSKDFISLGNNKLEKLSEIKENDLIKVISYFKKEIKNKRILSDLETALQKIRKIKALY